MKTFNRSISIVELVLVLAILIFLTGITINLYPDVARRARLVSNLNNIQNIYNASLLFEAESQASLPDDFDTLLQNNGIAIVLNPALLNTGPTAVPSLILQDLNDMSDVMDGIAGGGPVLGADVLADFQSRGVTQVRHALTTFTNETLGIGTPVTPIVATTNFCVINSVAGSSGETLLENLFNITVDPTHIYLCVGIGSNTSIIGSAVGLGHAPVYVPDVPKSSSITINSNYFRYVNVYDYSVLVGVSGLSFSLRFLGTVYPSEIENNAPQNDAFRNMNSLYEIIAEENF